MIPTSSWPWFYVICSVWKKSKHYNSHAWRKHYLSLLLSLQQLKLKHVFNRGVNCHVSRPCVIRLYTYLLANSLRKEMAYCRLAATLTKNIFLESSRKLYYMLMIAVLLIMFMIENKSQNHSKMASKVQPKYKICCTWLIQNISCWEKVNIGF